MKKSITINGNISHVTITIDNNKTVSLLECISDTPIESIEIIDSYLEINKEKIFKTKLPDQKVKSYKIY